MEYWIILDSFNWSLITATTFGYGDFKPSKMVPKLISTIIVIVGMSLTGIIIAVALNTATTALENHADQNTIEHMKEI